MIQTMNCRLPTYLFVLPDGRAERVEADGVFLAEAAAAVALEVSELPEGTTVEVSA